MAPTASVQALATSRSSRARLRWSDLSRRKASSRLPWAPMQFYTRPRWRGWANGGSPRGCQDLLVPSARDIDASAKPSLTFVLAELQKARHA